MKNLKKILTIKKLLIKIKSTNKIPKAVHHIGLEFLFKTYG